MKFVLSIWFVILSALIMGGCAPSAEEQKVPSNELKFEPKLSDRELPWDRISSRSQKVFFPPDTSVVLSGSKLMNTFENLMTIGDLLNDPAIRRRGHDLTRAFYANPDNTTSAQVKDSLYLEAALGEKKVVLLNLLRKKLTEIQATPEALAKTVREVQPIAASVNSKPLSLVSEVIQNIMDAFVARLQANNASKDVWKALREDVNNKYRVPLSSLGRSLAQISASKSIAENAKYMRAVKTLPLDAQLLAAIENEISSAVNLEKRLQGLNSTDEGVKVIMDVWLLLDAEGRKAQFYKFSPRLYNLLSLYSDEEIKILRDNTSYNPSKIMVRRTLQAVLKMYGVEELKKSILPALRKQVPVKFEEKLKSEIAALPGMIEKKINSLLTDREKMIKQLLVGTNYREFFVDLSVKWGQKEIYAGQSRTVGLERDRYRVESKKGGVINFSPDDSVSKSATTSSVLGSSLSMSGKRFDRVTEFENITYDNVAYYQMVMDVLNKIPALGGFKKIDDQIYPSFHVLKDAGNPFDRPLDIKTQAGSEFYYAVPDFIALRPPFLMDRERTQQYGIRFSVYNQAELLRGLSQMVEFFRDWHVNGFDVKMARYKLGDLIPDLPPHLERELLFPKDKLFEYSLGIASIILENMKREGSGLVMMNHEGQVFYGDELERAKQAQTLLAGMVDVQLNDRDDTIRTSALSKYVIAMAKFVNAVESFENSRSKMLNEVTNGEKVLARRLKESVSQIRLLMTMMCNFLVHKMQRDDGTMDAQYSVKMRKVISSSRNFEDQVLAIQALLATGETLGMGVYVGAAYDTYFGLNRVFFNDEAGFYSASDRAWRLPDPYAFTEYMVALAELSKKTDFSRGQIQRLLNRFKGELVHGHASINVEKVFLMEERDGSQRYWSPQ